jgi:hypothetical protein
MMFLRVRIKSVYDTNLHCTPPRAVHNNSGRKMVMLHTLLLQNAHIDKTLRYTAEARIQPLRTVLE